MEQVAAHHDQGSGQPLDRERPPRRAHVAAAAQLHRAELVDDEQVAGTRPVEGVPGQLKPGGFEPKPRP